MWCSCLKSKELLDVESFKDIVYVSDPQISPNGDLIAFVTVKTNIEDNKYEYAIRVINLKGEEILNPHG